MLTCQSFFAIFLCNLLFEKNKLSIRDKKNGDNETGIPLVTQGNSSMRILHRAIRHYINAGCNWLDNMAVSRKLSKHN